ncbi:hypothetical protein [Aldersonia kunmingensis]|uniref:hypothetical protein n=1 Tax=Aldersonia kunmingensis TaxID=408066 RepID=UPI00082E362D|nr:hypothetical protein [Aldersonia kunmingensis]
MDWSDGHRTGLNSALSEATCLGIEVDQAAARVTMRLDVLTLPDDGSNRSHRPVTLQLDQVGRIAASLRAQSWNDTEATVYPLDLNKLDEVVQSFGGAALHGWEFIDLPESSWTQWRELLSIDTTLSGTDDKHLLELSLQEGTDPRELDLRVWFGDLSVTDDTGRNISLHTFMADSKRWWDAHDHHDPRAVADEVAPPL